MLIKWLLLLLLAIYISQTVCVEIENDENSELGQDESERMKRQGKRVKVEPWRHIGLGKRHSEEFLEDGYMRKRANTGLEQFDHLWMLPNPPKRAVDPTWAMLGLGKRNLYPVWSTAPKRAADPTWAMLGLGKRAADPTWAMVGLGRRR